MFKRVKFSCVFISIIFIISSMAGCSPNVNDFYPEDDVLTQTMLSSKKTLITVLVKHAFSINIFEQAVEAKFPTIDIIQVGNYTSEMGKAEYLARIKNNDLTDIVMTWPLEIGEEYWSDRLVDFSSMSLSSKYSASMLNQISRDGKLYYLPGPAQVRALVYNKTLFKEKGWLVPTDFEGFLALCKQIEQDGIRALQLGLGNSEVFDTVFTGFGYAQSYSSPLNAQNMAKYDNREGSLEDNYSGALDTFETLMKEGVVKKEDINIIYSDRERMLFNRECAMVEDSVLLARMGKDYNGCTDEFALMPFFNPIENGDYTRLYPVCYIGVDKKLEQAKNKNKFDLVKQILNYISTPEGQETLAADTGAMFSSLLGTTSPDIPEIKDLLNSLEEGRYAIFPTLKNAQTALRTGLKQLLNGEQTRAEIVAKVDKANITPEIPMEVMVLGRAAKDFTLIETGNFLTDAMRKESGCDIALFLDNGKDGRYNGKGVSSKIYKGDLTSYDIKRILPDLKHQEKGVMWKVEMTGANLIKTLEYSISVDNNKTGWFYYFSGLHMTYAPSFPQGSRIKKIKDSNGKAIDLNKIYSVAITDYSVNSDCFVNKEETEILISSIFERALAEQQIITPSNDGRFKIFNKLLN